MVCFAALHELDPVFKSFSDSENVLSMLFSLGYKRPIVIQSMYIFKVIVSLERFWILEIFQMMHAFYDFSAYEVICRNFICCSNQALGVRLCHTRIILFSILNQQPARGYGLP